MDRHRCVTVTVSDNKGPEMERPPGPRLYGGQMVTTQLDTRSPPLACHRITAQVPMDQEAISEGTTQHFTYRCWVCDKSVLPAQVRSCRNPACLQTLCSVWCGIVHNRRICPSDAEIQARSDTIRKQAQLDLDGGEHRPCKGIRGRRDPARGRVQRSRSRFRGTTPHPNVV